MDRGWIKTTALNFLNGWPVGKKHYSIIYGAHPIHLEKNYWQLVNVLDAFLRTIYLLENSFE